MTGYAIVDLSDMLETEEVGEDKLKTILSDFVCPMNLDVEDFLRTKSILFSKQGIAATHLVFLPFRGEPVLVGYFSLASKGFRISLSRVSKNMGKRVKRFAHSVENNVATVSAPLIGQLGKNYSNDYNKLISGDVLLKMAEDKVRETQKILGGKFVYLECEDKPVLRDFYESNGFVCFDRRPLDGDERDMLSGTELLQMLKYLH